MKRLSVGVLALAGLAVVACFSERGAGPVSGAAECRVPVTEAVELTGHLIDSGNLSRLLDDVLDLGGDYVIERFDVG